jgi:hypothetical protein
MYEVVAFAGGEHEATGPHALILLLRVAGYARCLPGCSTGERNQARRENARRQEHSTRERATSCSNVVVAQAPVAIPLKFRLPTER